MMILRLQLSCNDALSSIVQNHLHNVEEMPLAKTAESRDAYPGAVNANCAQEKESGGNAIDTKKEQERELIARSSLYRTSKGANGCVGASKTRYLISPHLGASSSSS